VPVILIINIDHLPTAPYAISTPMIPSAHNFSAFAISSCIAAFLPSISDVSYELDLPPKISVSHANISLTILAPTITSAEINPRYCDTGLLSSWDVVVIIMIALIKKSKKRYYISIQTIAIQILKSSHFRNPP
jgi:hypothetical protein